jgi:hypothetical protein
MSYASREKMMSLEIRDAIQIARAQFLELLPDLALTRSDVRVEEIEKDGQNWSITFSVANPNFSPDALLKGIRSGITAARIAKVVVVDGESGELLAVRQHAA